MSLTVGTGSSKQTFTEPAVKEAMQIAQTKLGGQPAHLAIVFASIHYDHAKVLEVVTSIMPEQSRIVGCTAAGEITETGVENNGIVVMLLSMPGTKIESLVIDPLAGSTKQAGVSAGDQLVKAFQKKPKAILAFADSLTVDTTEFLEGLTHVVGKETLIAGTLAGDDLLFKRTYQYHQKNYYTGKVVLVGLDGEFKIGMSAHHGWRPLSTPQKISKAHGNFIQGIAGKASLDLLYEYFGEENIEKMEKKGLSRLLLPYPIGMWQERDNHWLIRSILSVTPKGEFLISASFPDNAPIHLMVGTNSELLGAAEWAAYEAKQQLDGTPKAILNFSGVARSTMLNLQAGEEIKRIMNLIDNSIQLVGCYNYGEIVTFRDGGAQETVVQNQSSSVVILGE